MAQLNQNVIEIPNGVSVQVAGSKITCKGPKGTSEKTFKTKGAKITVDGGKVVVEDTDLTMLNTIGAHIKNMCNGVNGGYSHTLKILYSHFPISVEVKGPDIILKNFIGEKQPRHARIIGSTKVEAKGQEVKVSGPSREDVGQTIANIKSATKIRRRDSRVFQDGLYIIE